MVLLLNGAPSSSSPPRRLPSSATELLSSLAALTLLLSGAPSPRPGDAACPCAPGQRRRHRACLTYLRSEGQSQSYRTWDQTIPSTTGSRAAIDLDRARRSVYRIGSQGRAGDEQILLCSSPDGRTNSLATLRQTHPRPSSDSTITMLLSRRDGSFGHFLGTDTCHKRSFEYSQAL